MSATAAEAGIEPFLGEIIHVPFDFCPNAFVEAKGQVLTISGNQALFALLGTTYGGDGKTTFALPSLTAPEGTRYCIALQGVFPSRSD
jgi:microcystin-dependent protein